MRLGSPCYETGPLSKTPAISNFQREQGLAATFRGKRWEIAARLGRMARRPGHAADAVLRCCAQAREGGSEGGPTRSARKRPPPHQNRDHPRETPLFLTGPRCRSRASTRAISLTFLTTRYGSHDRRLDCQRETGRQGLRRAAGRQIARCHSTGAVPNRGGTTVATAQARGSTNAADASIQNDSGPAQGPATGSVVC